MAERTAAVQLPARGALVVVRVEVEEALVLPREEVVIATEEERTWALVVVAAAAAACGRRRGSRADRRVSF